MFWIVLLTLALLTAVAYGWVVVHSSHERITISLELVKILPAIRKAKEGARALVHRDHDFEEP